MNTHCRITKDGQGFSLIVTVTLMVLLSMLAIGMLALSSTVLRSSRHDFAEQEARANARLGLMLALGQLQKAAGPDQRTTAPANLVSPSVPAGLTGVWESVRLRPDGGHEMRPGRAKSTDEPDAEFVAWLNSDSFGTAANPSNPAGSGSGRKVVLLDEQEAGAATDRLPLTAKVLDLSKGGVAWATVDESVKARVDLVPFEERAGNPSPAQVRSELRDPARPVHEMLPGLDAVASADHAGKLASHQQLDLFFDGGGSRGNSRFHDVTPFSLGLNTDPVNGGLKSDLSLAFSSDELPAELAGRHLYSGTANPAVPADPFIASLHEYYRLHTQGATPTVALQSRIPASYDPALLERRTRLYTPNPEPVEGNIIAPVVSRVNVVFSLVGRSPAHDHWANTIPTRTGDAQRNSMVYLIYTPCVTLYNPYTVPVEVDRLKVTFQHLPLGFKFFRNGSPQTTSPALLSQFHISSQNRTDWEDSFSCTLSPTAGTRGRAAPVTLGPGEARIFGLNHPARTTWGQMANYLWQNDLDRSLTLDLTTGQGYNTKSGFIVDWLAPTGAGQAADNSGLGVFGVKSNDSINVEITPVAPGGVDYFAINVTANVRKGGTGSSRELPIASYRYRYGTIDNLISVLEEGEHPEIGRVDYPYRRERGWNFNQMVLANPDSTPVERWTAPQQFAVFSLGTRTSNDSLFPTRPGRDTSFIHRVVDMDISNSSANHPAKMPMELSFMPILSNSTESPGAIQVFSADDPRTFFFSGWGVETGFLNHPVIEVPREPLRSLVQFRNVDLANSGFLPMPGQTAGDSFAPPLMPAGSAITEGSSLGYGMADHAWLANDALFDHYLLSGLRDRDDAVTLVESGTAPFNNRAVAALPASLSKDDALAELRSDEAWQSAAAFFLNKGAFNINSTSVKAWRAVLSSLKGKEIPYFNSLSGSEEEAEVAGSPFVRQLDGAFGSVDAGGGFVSPFERWQGIRSLDDEEIETLAEEIVKVNRQRGPFFSLSHFLNRNLKASGAPENIMGAIQQAIEHAGVNAGFDGLRQVTSGDAGSFSYANPDAAVGDCESAGSAFLSQADVVQALGPITTRGDTFIVRAYGESRNSSGRVLATARCEAVVQRMPDYVDPRDHPKAMPSKGTEDNLPPGVAMMSSQVNENFGRRFSLVSFRWLGDSEA